MKTWFNTKWRRDLSLDEDVMVCVKTHVLFVRFNLKGFQDVYLPAVLEQTVHQFTWTPLQVDNLWLVYYNLQQRQWARWRAAGIATFNPPPHTHTHTAIREPLRTFKTASWPLSNHYRLDSRSVHSLTCSLHKYIKPHIDSGVFPLSLFDQSESIRPTDSTPAETFSPWICLTGATCSPCSPNTGFWFTCSPFHQEWMYLMSEQHKTSWHHVYWFCNKYIHWNMKLLAFRAEYVRNSPNGRWL